MQCLMSIGTMFETARQLISARGFDSVIQFSECFPVNLRLWLTYSVVKPGGDGMFSSSILFFFLLAKCKIIKFDFFFLCKWFIIHLATTIRITCNKNVYQIACTSFTNFIITFHMKWCFCESWKFGIHCM